jgi:hypothetical protein
MKELNLMSIPNTCAPVALKYLSGKDDVEVTEACLRQGIFEDEIIEAAKLLGITLIKMDGMKTMEVRKFMKEYPKGKFLVTTHDHIFVIQDRVQIDPYLETENAKRALKSLKPIPGTRRMLLEAWKVIG